MNDSLGSLWRKWDMHVHGPGTKKNDQYLARTSLDDAFNLYRDKLEQSDVAVFGITDHFSADSFFAFLKRFTKKHPDSKKAKEKRSLTIGDPALGLYRRLPAFMFALAKSYRLANMRLFL